MPRYKMIDGETIPLNAEEEAQRDLEEQQWADGEFDREIANLREKRNKLLAETDYFALSDRTMTVSMSNYRQDLRDITNGLTTADEVRAVVFPEKPEV
tara:strand:- start:194 stop:487 length:294 start_codon:yes stop_codon:yes gene_type:complete